MNVSFLYIIKLVILIGLTLLGISFVYGAAGKLKTIDRDIRRIAKANEKYYGENAELRVRKMYKTTGIVMIVVGIFSLAVYILNDGKTLILE